MRRSGASRSSPKVWLHQTAVLSASTGVFGAGRGGLVSQKRGPKGNSRRTDEIVRQIIRYRFLDPLSTPEVIAQKLRQLEYVISTRSVERVIADFGLQKKTPQTPSKPRRRSR
jgi:hypothetical protein